jgi:hypothetical protein
MQRGAHRRCVSHSRRTTELRCAMSDAEDRVRSNALDRSRPPSLPRSSLHYSSSPALRRPSVQIVKCSGRRIGNQSLRLEMCKTGSIGCKRSIACRASSQPSGQRMACGHDGGCGRVISPSLVRRRDWPSFSEALGTPLIADTPRSADRGSTSGLISARRSGELRPQE